MNLEKVSKVSKKPVSSLLAILVAGSFMASISSCAKECGECPSGQYLVVNNAKDKQCYCCPDDTVYDQKTGTCQY